MDSKVRRRVAVAVLVGAVALVAAELAGRMMGLGDPPIVMLDRDIEYYPVPNQTSVRFGQVYTINRFGMRSDDAPADRLQRADSVALFGDSIVFGPGLDQDETIGAQLQAQLRKARSDDALIVNAVASSSWGPENILAFYRKNEPMRGALAVVVQSTHDIVDVAHDPNHPPPDPTSKPFGALHDALLAATRVAYLRYHSGGGETYEGKVARTTKALDELLTALKTNYRRVVLVFHPDATEATANASQGEDHFKQAAVRNGVAFLSNLRVFHEAYASGRRPHGDDIHLSAAGAELVAGEIAKIVQDPLTLNEPSR